jgi:hypothetical protein
MPEKPTALETYHSTRKQIRDEEERRIRDLEEHQAAREKRAGDAAEVERLKEALLDALGTPNQDQAADSLRKAKAELQASSDTLIALDARQAESPRMDREVLNRLKSAEVARLHFLRERALQQVAQTEIGLIPPGVKDILTRAYAANSTGRSWENWLGEIVFLQPSIPELSNANAQVWADYDIGE